MNKQRQNMTRLVWMVTLAALFSMGCGKRPARKPTVADATATFTTEAITVDGMLDEATWQSAVVITNFMVPETFAVPISRTEARILWDTNYLYVGFLALDKDVWGVLTEHDDC